MKVTAGKSLPADADYKNLIWKNIPEKGKVKRNNLLATTASWGPLFWVSLDLIIHNPVPGWSNLLAFKAHGAKSNKGNRGDRFPSIFLWNSGQHNASHYLHFVTSLNRQANYYYNHHHVKTNTWYNVVIQQISRNGKVRGRGLADMIILNRFTSSSISMEKRFTREKIKMLTKHIRMLKHSLGTTFIKLLMRATKTLSGRTLQ